MIGMAAAMGIGRFVYTPILPGMMEALGLSAADAGLIASANYLGYLAGALLAAGGWAEGRERALMLGALAASTLLLGAMGLTEETSGCSWRSACSPGSPAPSSWCSWRASSSATWPPPGAAASQALHFAGVGLGIAASAAMMLVLCG